MSEDRWLRQTQEELQRVQTQLQQAKAQLQSLSAIVAAMRGSKFWKLRNLWFKLKRKLGSSEPFEVDLVPHGAAYPDSYLAWTERNLPRLADLKRLAEVVDFFKYQPQFSIIMPVYNTPQKFLEEAIESVLNQVYSHWELCIVDDASTHSYVRPLLESYAETDDRIKLKFRTENGHIVQASNATLELASGEFIVTFDHDDLLTPDALYEITLLLNEHPEADFIYSDQDMINEADQLTNPFFKPDWCPDSFLSHMYTCHLSCYRRSLVKEIGGYRLGFEGSQDYDLVLRLTEKTDRIFHISKVLYHWRIHAGSVASAGEDVKSYAYVAAERAIAEALERRGEPGVVSPAADLPPGSYTIRYKIAELALVQIIVFASGGQLNQCLESVLVKSTYPNYQVVVISESHEDSTQKLMQKWLEQQPNKIRFLTVEQHQSAAEFLSSVVAAIDAKYLLFLSPNVQTVTPDWIEAMMEQAQRSSIGAVGARIFQQETVRHAGILVGVGGVAARGHQHFPSSSAGYANQIKTTNNYSAVSGECLMCRRELFEQVGGFYPERKQYSDVDLCLKFVDRGYRNVYLPHVVLHYNEPADALVLTEAQLEQEAHYLRSTWPQFMQHDPCYNPNLTKLNGNYSFNL